MNGLRIVLFFLQFAVGFSEEINGDVDLSNTDISVVRGTEIREFDVTRPFNQVHDRYLTKGKTLVKRTKVSLTKNAPGETGLMCSHHKLSSMNWEIQTTFRITGPSCSGEGMALWYTNRCDSGNFFGGNPIFKGLAVVVDTRQNGDATDRGYFPQIYVTFGVASHSKARWSDDGYTLMAGEPCDISPFYACLHGESDLHLLVRYFNETLSVYVSTDVATKWAHCTTINGMLLPPDYKIGVTAQTTASYSNAHDVTSLRIFDLSGPEKLDVPRVPYLEGHRERVAVREEELMSNLDDELIYRFFSSLAVWGQVAFVVFFLVLIVCFFGIIMCIAVRTSIIMTAGYDVKNGNR